MRRPFALALVVTISTASTSPLAAQTPAADTFALAGTGAAEAERQALAALAAAPARRIVLPTSPGQPFVENRAAHADALAACRHALSGGQRTPDVYASLGLLYLWSDALDGTRGDGARSAIDYFSLALEDDPAHPVTIEYLGRGAVIRALRRFLSPPEQAGVEMLLKRAADRAPRGAAVRVALAKWLTGRPGQLAAAAAVTDDALRVEPESVDALTMRAALRVRDTRPADALDDVARVVARPLTATQEAAAWLVAATARVQRREMQEAGDALDRAQVVTPAMQADLAYQLGVEPPVSIVWSMGKQSELDNRAAVALLDRRKFAGARQLLLKVVDRTPDEPKYWRNLGMASFNLDLYAEAAHAFETAAELGPLDRSALNQMALAQAVTGEYATAATSLVAALRAAPDRGPSDWAVVYAYASNGWTAPQRVWRATHAAPADRRAEIDEAYGIFDLVDRGLRDLMQRARRKNNRYATWKHDVARYRLLGEALEAHRDDLRRDVDFTWAQQERQDIMSRLGATYAELALKPAIPSEALRLAQSAAVDVDTGRFEQAEAKYRQAAEVAPWWADAHYNRALAMRVSGYHMSLAIAEMRVCLSLNPPKNIADAAAAKIRQWQGEVW